MKWLQSIQAADPPFSQRKRRFKGAVFVWIAFRAQFWPRQLMPAARYSRMLSLPVESS